MNAIFERNLDQVSLILKDCSAVEADGFETKMACVGGVPGLLPMSVRQINGETAYVYEVTARQPLSEYLKGRALRASELAEILKTVLGILEGLETYLLDPGHILFSADRIFAQGSFRELWLCYVPSHSRPMREGFYGLTMELLSNVDQKDRDAIVLGYRFAHELQEDNVSFSDLRACLYGQYKEAEALPGFNEEKIQGEAFEFARGNEWYGSGDFAQGKEWNGLGESAAGEPDRRNRQEGDEENFMKVPVERKRKSLSFHGLNRRTILIVVIGGAVLLAAFLGMHPETARKLLTGLRENPLLTGGTLLAMAAVAAVFFVLKRRAVVGETRAAGASSWALDESAWAAAKADSENPFGNPLRTASSTHMESSISASNFTYTGQGSGGFAGTTSTGRDRYGLAGTTSFDESILTTCVLAPVKKAAAARLRPEGQAEAFKEIPLQKDNTILGKQADLADIVIPSPVISRIHARISRKGQSWYLTDLNSRNGTAVNNVPLESMKEVNIENGDTLRFANLEYVFEIKS